ncbi:MAG TPA: PDZ domain-containing protein, partial [Spirochaetota bacterium]|nr:PDZ domain-containing protein [Spirochaetota bacterium]
MDAIYKKIKGQFYNKLLIAIIIGVALSAVSLYFVFVCQQADDGLKIDDRFMALEVRPGSPAAEAGIRTGDRVLAIGGVRLARIGELRTVHESVMHTVSALCGVLVPHRAVPYEIQRGEAVVTVLSEKGAPTPVA